VSQVDFYVLRQGGEQARQLFACKLAEKAWRLQHTVHIATANQTAAEQLDQLLWTFRDGSFVPHHIAGSSNNDSPVTIGFGSGEANSDLLINLADDIPTNTDSFPRVAELVSSDEDSKQVSRKRFAAYRDQGHEINTHKL
jgi:DNA polymerase-3 subunit chi